MAYWSEDKITKWEKIWFNKSLAPHEYNYIATRYPGYFLLLLHIWNPKKWEHDWLWVDQPMTYENGKPYLDTKGNKLYIGTRTYSELFGKVRAKGFKNNKTEYKVMIDEIENDSYKSYVQNKQTINKLKEIW